MLYNRLVYILCRSRHCIQLQGYPPCTACHHGIANQLFVQSNTTPDSGIEAHCCKPIKESPLLAAYHKSADPVLCCGPCCCALLFLSLLHRLQCCPADSTLLKLPLTCFSLQAHTYRCQARESSAATQKRTTSRALGHHGVTTDGLHNTASG